MARKMQNKAKTPRKVSTRTNKERYESTMIIILKRESVEPCKEMGKYRVPRFEFLASSCPSFEFPDLENSDPLSESSCPLSQPSWPPTENLDTMIDLSFLLTHLSFPPTRNSNTLTFSIFPFLCLGNKENHCLGYTS